MPPDAHGKAAQSQARAGPRTPALDGLRGYAAAAVALYHGILHFDTSQIDRVLYQPIALVPWAELPAKLLLIPFNGKSSVILFFILSGLVLRGSLERLGGQAMWQAAAAFTLRRIARIYPAVIVCMLAFFALSWACRWAGARTFPLFAPWQLLDNATLYYAAMHGPSWSVQVEICAVPFLLLAEVLRRGLGATGLLLALIYALVAIEYPVLVLRLPALWPYLFAFYAGMLMGEPAVGKATARLHPASGPIALLLFLVARHITARAAVSGLVAQVAAGALLVACVAYRRDALAAFLTRPVSLFLGRISYSFYLLNVIALYSCWAVVEAWVPAPSAHALAWGVLTGVVSVLLTIPAAALSERWVERPGIALGRMLTGWMRPQRRPVPALAAGAAGGR